MTDQYSLLLVIVSAVDTINYRKMDSADRLGGGGHWGGHCGACGGHCEDWGSHCRRRTMEGSLLAPSMNSSRLSFPSLFLSIWRKILSVRFSGVLSSSGIFITDPTILYIACEGGKRQEVQLIMIPSHTQSIMVTPQLIQDCTIC